MRRALLIAILGLPLVAADPESTVLVANAESWSSIAVANAYVRLRQLPPERVVWISGLSDWERIEVAELRSRILEPLVQALTTRSLLSSTDTVAYSADLPTHIGLGSDLGEQKPIPQLGKAGSLTGLTWHAPIVLAKRLDYLSLTRTNGWYRPSPAERRSLSPEQMVSEETALEKLKAKDWPGAFAILEPLARAVEDAGTWYNLACGRALSGDQAGALADLERAVTAGWCQAEHARRDKDFTSLKDDPAFKALCERMEAVVVPPPESGPCLPDPRRGLGWMAMQVAVTSGRGLSVAEAITGLERAAAADGTRPSGVVALMRNGDVRSTTRQWAFPGLVSALIGTAITAEILSGVLPAARTDLVGVVAGSPVFDWPGSGSVLLPGAIAEHLTSAGGILRWKAGQTPCTEFLRAGAAGTSGAVTEPYAIQAKFPSPFIHLHAVRGHTLGECFAQSVAAPYQLLVLGDPLSAPWAVPPAATVEVAEAANGARRISVATGAGSPAVRVRVHIDGELVTQGPPPTSEAPFAGRAPGAHRLAVVVEGSAPTRSAVMAVSTVMVPGDVPSLRVGSPRVAIGGVVAVELIAGVAPVTITHLGRVVATIAVGERKAEIPAASLGLGITEIVAERRDGEGRLLARSAPVVIDIQTPPPWAAMALPAEAVPGLLVDGAVVSEMLGQDWFAKRPSAMRIEGWIECGEEGQHQCCLVGGREAVLVIDGQELRFPVAGPGGRLAPLNLAKGWHRLTLTVGPGDGAFACWFGLRGRQPLDAGVGRCLPPSP